MPFFTLLFSAVSAPVFMDLAVRLFPEQTYINILFMIIGVFFGGFFGMRIDLRRNSGFEDCFFGLFVVLGTHTGRIVARSLAIDKNIMVIIISAAAGLFFGLAGYRAGVIYQNQVEKRDDEKS